MISEFLRDFYYDIKAYYCMAKVYYQVLYIHIIENQNENLVER